HLVTGQPPFSGENPDTMSLLAAVARGEPRRVTDLAPQLRPGIAQLVHDLMESKPEDRPASASVLVERLRRLERERPSEAKVPAKAEEEAAPSASRRALLMRRPQTLGIILGGVAVLAALIVGVYAGYHKLFPHDDQGGGNGDNGDDTRPP